jgi:uncharacterized oligopeptide transporter (OPT) family protein
VVPEVIVLTLFGLTAATTGCGVAVSGLAIGSGIIVGVRIAAAMLLGGVLSWIIAPRILVVHGIVAAEVRADILRWRCGLECR